MGFGQGEKAISFLIFQEFESSLGREFECFSGCELFVDG